MIKKVMSLLVEENDDDVWTDDELDRITVATEMIQEYLESISFGYSELEISSGEALDVPLWEPIMKMALDDTIGPKNP